MSSLEKCLFSSSARFLIGSFCFSSLSCMNSYIFFILTLYLIYGLQIFFFPFCSLPFHFLLFLLLCRNFLVWCSPTYWFLHWLPVLLVSKKLLPSLMSRSFFPTFSSRSFRVLGLMFKSLIHFLLIYMSGVIQGFNFIFLHVAI